METSIEYQIEDFLKESIHDFTKKGIPKDEIFIYMPPYVNRYICTTLYNLKKVEMLDLIMGCKIIAGYEKAVVIAFKDCVFYGIEPKIMRV